MTEQFIAEGFGAIGEQLRPIKSSTFLAMAHLEYVGECSIEDGMEPGSACLSFTNNWSDELAAVGRRLGAIADVSTRLGKNLQCIDIQAATDISVP